MTLCDVLRGSDTKLTGSDFWDFVEPSLPDSAVDALSEDRYTGFDTSKM